MKKVLVTGGAGYIGSVLTQLLLDKNYQVRVVDNLMWGEESLEEFKDNSNFELVVGDLREQSVIEQVVKDVYAVVNLAAIVGDPACAKDPELSEQTNWDMPIALFEASEKASVKRFVSASTCSNYGKMLDSNNFIKEDGELNPVSLYAKLKVKFEEFLLNSESNGMVATSLRFATAYGLSPRMRFDLTVNEFTKEVYLGRELVVFGEQFWRPYCCTEDLAKACIAVLEAEENIVDREVFNVGSTDENYQKKMIVDLIKEKIPEMKVKYVKKDEDPRDYRVSFEKIKERLNFQVSKRLSEGIDEIKLELSSGAITDADAQKYKNV